MATRFSSNARLILQKRYLKKDAGGKVIESAEEMLRRVARHVAQADQQWADAKAVARSEERFYRMLSDLWFLPNSPTLMNAGTSLGQLAACFVLPVRQHGEHLRRRQAYGHDPQIGRRYRIFLFPPASGQRCGPLHGGRVQRSAFVYDGV